MIFINTYVKDIKGVQMKKIFIVVLALFFINFPILYCDASTEETIQEQKSEFQIQDFIKNAKQYSGEFFENINIEDVLNDAIKGEVDNSTFLKRILNLTRQPSAERIPSASCRMKKHSYLIIWKENLWIITPLPVCCE